MLRPTARVETFGEFLSKGRTLWLPWFQRPYAWRPQRALKLLGDIRKAMDEAEERRRHYCVGVVRLGEREGRNNVSIADGSQRTITITMILALLRELAGSEAEKARLDAFVTGDPSGPRHLNIQRR